MSDQAGDKDKNKKKESRGYPYPKGYIRPDLQQYQYQAHEFEGEPCNESWVIRLPHSLKERMKRFKEEHGRMPSREVRFFLDELLPPQNPEEADDQ